MEGAIVLIILVVIVIFVVPIIIASSSNTKITNLGNDITAIKNYLKKLKEQDSKEASENPISNNEFYELKRMIERLQSSIDAKSDNFASPRAATESDLRWMPKDPPIEDIPLIVKETTPPEPIRETAKEAPLVEAIIPEMAKPVEPESTEEIIESFPPYIPAETTSTDITEDIPVADLNVVEPVLEYDYSMMEASVPPPATRANIKPPPPPPPVEKKTDFEQFIGEKLISIVGITILVLGIFFSVKWAIDRHLISDAGKIMIGVVSGTILLGFAHKLVKNYRAFSSILAGGGIAVLYFSIYEAYQAYHLLPQAGAFGIMVFITLITVILSVIYDKKELAIIAIVGGFGTPFFVSNGAGNYQVLFTYLLILNVGMFFLASFKKWNIINIICYALTVLIFGAWVSQSFNAAKGQAPGGMLFISLFFLIFFGMHIIYNLRHQKKFGYTEIVLLLSNSFIYLGFGLYFLKLIDGGKYQGSFTLALSAFNFVFAYVFYRRKNIDKNLVYLLIGMVLTFLSLTGPLQLDGNYITLFWACELVVMYWMGTKTGIQLLKNASILILVLTLISLVMDWNNGYYGVQINIMTVLLNKAFITSVVVCLAIFLNQKLLKKDEETHLVWGILPKFEYIRALGFLMIALVYVSLFLEVSYQSFAHTANHNFRQMMLWTFHLAFVVVLTFITNKRSNIVYVKTSMLVLIASLILYCIGFYSIIALRNDLMERGAGMGLYHWHYLMPLLATVAAGMIVRYVVKQYPKTDSKFKAMAWGITVIMLFTLSAEAVNIWVAQSYRTGFDISAIATKANNLSLPIIWSVCSLLLMLLGMRGKIKMLRIISLALFSLTIVKLFLYDISNVGQGGKIAAFIILGVILLIVSFMYQKIKGLFTEDIAKKDIEQTDPNQK
jgi:uncharacterized membrane protein